MKCTSIRFFSHAVLTVATAAVLCTHTPCFAAPTAETIRQQDQIQRGEEERQRQLEKQHKEMLEREPQHLAYPKPTQDNATEDSGVCVQVNSITLKGSTNLSESAKAMLVKPYMRRCLSMRDMNGLIRDIVNHYVERGYVTTRAYVAPQDLDSGTLEIIVIEGAIEGIQLNLGSEQDQRRVSTAFPGLRGKTLNLRDIEQGLDQLNRLPSSNAKMEIVPGAQPGTSRIVVTDAPSKTWRARASLDNSGQKNTGTNQYTLSFDKDNLLGLNDLLTVNWSADANAVANAERHKSESASAYYSLPLGYWTITASASSFDYHTELPGGGVDYRSTGDTTSYALDVSRVLHRNADSKTSAGLAFSTKAINNYLEGEKLKASSYNLSTLKASLDHNRRFLSGVLSLGGEYSLGLPVLDAPKDKTSELTTPKHEYYKLVFNGSYMRPFTVAEHEVTFNTRGQVQWTPDTLYNAERLSLGSRYTVRGFQRDSLSGDSGGYVRNELSTSILSEKSRTGWIQDTLGDPQLYVGYDLGSIHRDPKDSFERGTLQGMATGLRSSSEHFGMEFCLSHAVDAPQFMKNRDWEVYWTFTVKI